MFIQKIELLNYRNYRQGFLKLLPGTNVIYGANARGKTNVLESICLMSTARSHRGAREQDLILRGCATAKIKIDFFARARDYTGEMTLFLNKRKNVLMNGVPVERTSRLMHYLNTVIFCPENLRLVKGAPRERRRMLDLGLCQLRQKYFYALSEYYRVLDQRNKLLKEQPKSELLWVWNEQLMEHGTAVIWYRHAYLKRLGERAAALHREICGEALEFQYNCGMQPEDFSDRACIKDAFNSALAHVAEREARFGISLAGPHRDDFEIRLNGGDARLFASQGQQRTAVLSLKLAEAEILSEELGEPPVLLLDDVLSELDAVRRRYILNHIETMQVLVTCTDAELFKSMRGANLIDVEDIEVQ